MNFRHIHSIAAAILAAMSQNPPAEFKNIPGVISEQLDGHSVPFAERRFVCMVIAQMANANALGVHDKSARKLLAKVEDYALKAHDRWSNSGFFTGKLRAKTVRELDTLATEERQMENLASVVREGVEHLGASLVDAAKYISPTTVTVAPKVELPAPVVNVQNTFEAPEPAKSEALPARVGPGRKADKRDEKAETNAA